MVSRTISVRLDVDLIRRLDEVAGDRGRNAFVRDAIERSLGGGGKFAPKTGQPKQRLRNSTVREAAAPREVSGDGFERVPERWRNDARSLVLSALAVPMRQSEAKAAMGWLPERFEKVLGLCLEAGLIERDDEGRFVGSAG